VCGVDIEGFSLLLTIVLLQPWVRSDVLTAFSPRLGVREW
jgi:hypothetical protein